MKEIEELKENFISHEHRRFKWGFGRAIASSFSGFLAGIIVTVIFFLTLFTITLKQQIDWLIKTISYLFLGRFCFLMTSRKARLLYRELSSAFALRLPKIAVCVCTLPTALDKLLNMLYNDYSNLFFDFSITLILTLNPITNEEVTFCPVLMCFRNCSR